MSETPEKPVSTPPAKTGSGLEQNVAGALCYALGWVTGIIFFIIEKDNKFVRFHAFQSIIVFGAASIVYAIFFWVPVLYYIVGALVFVLWIFLMYQACTSCLWSVISPRKTAARPPNSLPGQGNTRPPARKTTVFTHADMGENRGDFLWRKR
jgi:uncharacterized membrane protein